MANNCYIVKCRYCGHEELIWKADIYNIQHIRCCNSPNISIRKTNTYTRLPLSTFPTAQLQAHEEIQFRRPDNNDSKTISEELINRIQGMLQ